MQIKSTMEDKMIAILLKFLDFQDNFTISFNLKIILLFVNITLSVIIDVNIVHCPVTQG